MKYLAILCLIPTVVFGQDEEDVYETPTFNWQPAVNQTMNDLASISLDDRYVFLDGSETRRLMDLYGNPPTDMEMGLVAQAENPFGWFVVFEFDDMGFVKDDDKDELDADAIYESFLEGSKQSNKYREEMGIAPLNLVGWKVEPNYEETTNNLEWCLEFESGGEPVLNHNIRVLGRRGVTIVTLVCNPEQFDDALAGTRRILEGFSYNEGQRYSDYVSGDKIAEYGLAALVTGGAVAIAAKSGILGKLLKPILLGLAAAGAWIASTFKKIFARSKDDDRRV